MNNSRKNRKHQKNLTSHKSRKLSNSNKALKEKYKVKPILTDYPPHKAKFFFITFSYILLAFGVVFFEWSIFTILFSYIVEFIILLLLFSVSNFDSKTKAKNRHDNRGNVIGGSIPLILFNYFTILIIASLVDSRFIFPDLDLSFFLEEILPSSILISIGYALSLAKLPLSSMKEVLSDNLMYQALALTACNMIGLAIFTVLNDSDRLITIIMLISIRIIFEWIFGRKMRII